MAVAPESAGTRKVVDRERLSNDVLNTGVAAALIGGFALGNLDLSHSTMVYVLSAIAVHGCTCSCLTSAFLYRTLNCIHDDDAALWASRHRWLLAMPFMKFVMGCACYLLTVIVRSYEALEGVDAGAQIAVLVVGIMSMSSVLVCHVLLVRDSPKQTDGGK